MHLGMTHRAPLCSWSTRPQYCFLGSSRVKWWRRKTSERWATKEQCPSPSRDAPENQMGSWGPGGTSALSNGVSQLPRRGFPVPAARGPPSHCWLGGTMSVPTLGFPFQAAWASYHCEHTVGRREQILSIWNSHFCFCAGENALWSLQVKLRHQDHFSGSFWPLDVPEYCHHNCKLNFQLARSPRSPLLHMYSED